MASPPESADTKIHDEVSTTEIRPDRTPENLRPNYFDIVVARATLFVTLAAYAWFWTWYIWTSVASPSIEVTWMSLFGFVVAIDHLNHAWLLWIVPRFEKIRPDATADRSDRPRRVAMIVTKAPSEPFEVLRKTLLAMLAQDVPPGASVDVWIADERPSPDTLAWCASEGVRVSTREGREDYHLPDWPRRTRSKEGNLRFWYDTYSETYDIVCQFDADHAPRIDYLSHVLWRFNDPSIGYVAAPNLSTNAPCWFGRARRELEAPYYGSFLGSLGARSDDSSFFMPTCTGSHYAVSMEAVRAIGGGLGPELDEDLSTTMMISKAGFRGAYAVDAIADGDGPETVEDGLLQEVQWSRSAVILFTRWLTTVFPWRKAKIGAVVRSTLIALWYATLPMWLIWFVGGPIVAMYSGWCMDSSDGTDCVFNLTGMVIHVIPAWFVNIGWEAYQKKRGWMRPSDAPAFSFAAIPYRAMRALWMAIGVVTGLVQLAIRRTPSFRVTNKGETGVRRLTWMTLWPIYAVLAIFSAVFWSSLAFDHRAYNGFYAWFGQIATTAIAAMCFVGHAVEQRGSFAGSMTDSVSHSATIIAGATSIALAVVFPESRSMISSTGVSNAVWVPHWIFPEDQWISIGFLGGAALVGVILASIGVLRGPSDVSTPSGNVATRDIPVVTETANVS